MFFWESESTSPTVSSEDESYSSTEEEEEDGEDGDDSDEKANKLVSVTVHTFVYCGIVIFHLKCSRIIFLLI